jgi:addiction module HigA family antidote
MNKQKTYKLTKDILPSHATHPGVLLFDEIEYRGISQKDLANTMHIAPTVLNEIIHGKRNLTAELALKLEKALDIDAIIWMRLQVKFDIDTIRIRERDKKYRSAPVTLAIASEPKAKYAKLKKAKRHSR